MNADAAQSLGVTLAAIVAVSLALTQAVGPLLVYLTEAVKATGRVRDGWSGIVTLVLGMAIGGALGGLTQSMAADTQGYGFGTMVAMGVFGGALMAAGAVKTYKAMGDVNTKALVIDSTSMANADEVETGDSGPALGAADVAAMNEALAANHGPVADNGTNVTPAPPLPVAAT